MSGKPAVSTIACAPGTLGGGLVRTRFFDGMFLTQADLENEQRTWRLKRRLTNRALGTGVVWGLGLGWNAEKRAFRLSPGYALDCCGNDLVVECPVELGERELWSRADPALRTAFGAWTKASPTADPRALLDACVVLQYSECAEDARAVHLDACAGPAGSCEPSRVRESARLLLVPAPAAPPKTPPELFLEELEKFRASLPAQVRDAIFPPQTGTPPPSTQLAPVQLTVQLPGAPLRSVTLDVPASGTASAPGLPLSTVETPSAGRRSGVVTFTLTPSAGWGFTGGQVRDQGRVVETVTPPMAPSMYWALDIALPDGLESVTADFEFELADLVLAQSFGGHQQGKLRAHIRGAAQVKAQGGGGVDVALLKLEIATELAEVVDEPVGAGCLSTLVPWGATVDPANGSRIARTLVLAALYGFLSELVARDSAKWQEVARTVYRLAWLALFGVNAAAPVDEPYRRALAELILSLYQRWCDGFAYPGPRCTDEHHGVYLGCARIDRQGQIQSFDPWECRRYVITGPLLAHWGNQLGLAPIDVIVGRFVRATCCLAGLPAIALPPSDQLGFGIAQGSSVHVGTTASVADYAAMHKAGKVRWVSVATLAGRARDAFTARVGDRPVTVLAAKLEDGGALAIAVPAEVAEAGPAPSRIRDDVRNLLRRGELRTREPGRAAVADFVDAVMRRLPVTALGNTETAPDIRKVAEAAARRGAMAADLVERGTDAMAARIGLGGDPKAREALAELVDRAEHAVDQVVLHTVKALGPAVDRPCFAEPRNQERLMKALSGAVPGITPQLVRAAAEDAAGSGG